MAQKFAKFGIVGGLGVIWKTLFLLFFVEVLTIPAVVAIYPTATLVLIHNYEGNRYWTYGNTTKRSWKSFRHYALANGLSLIIYFGFFYVLNIYMYYLLASISAVGVAGILNFILANKVFRTKELA